MEVLRPKGRLVPQHPTETTAPDRRDPGVAHACAFPTKEKEGCMNLFVLIGVVVVVLFLVGYLRFY
jgi:hypothetical protein